MDILRFLFYAFLAYLAFRFIFNFVIPVYRTTRQVRKGFREMQERMNRHMSGYPSQSPAQPVPDRPEKGSSADYIDFEEIKD